MEFIAFLIGFIGGLVVAGILRQIRSGETVEDILYEELLKKEKEINE